MSPEEGKAEPMRWRRRGRVTLRRLSRADLAGLQWRVGRRRADTVQVEAWPGAEAAAGLICRAPGAQLAVELDHQLVGALLAEGRLQVPAEPPQPWVALETRDLDRFRRRSGEGISLRGNFDAVLCGRGALWGAEISPAMAAQILVSGRLAMAQQRGCRGCWSLVRAASWGAWRERLSPEAFVQQVHAGGLVDPHLAIYMRAGYLIRGFYRDGDELEIAMVWARRAY